VFALRDKCPHKGGRCRRHRACRKVACPLHDWKIHLDSGWQSRRTKVRGAVSGALEGEAVFLSLIAEKGSH